VVDSTILKLLARVDRGRDRVGRAGARAAEGAVAGPRRPDDGPQDGPGGDHSSLRAQVEDGDVVARARIRKNQVKAAEFEAMISRWAISAGPQEAPEIAPWPKQVKRPSMIVHRTRDADTDEILALRAEMEEAIKQNAALRLQLVNIHHDFAAM